MLGGKALTMTTYSYKITLDDCEYIALKATLEQRLKHCEQKVSDGDTGPYLLDKINITQLLEKLKQAAIDATMTSTSSSCW
jgi:hypothetical protein